MRINVYHEELTHETEIVTTFVEETNRTYYGVRIFLASAPELHHEPNDDDRSAITFWYGSEYTCRLIAQTFENVWIDSK